MSARHAAASQAAHDSPNAAEPLATTFTQLDELREGREILRTEGQALLDLSRRLDASFCAAVEYLSTTRGAVIVTGIGKAGLIGQKVTATLCSTGTRAYFLHPTEALHGDLGCVGPEDVVLAFSNSGETAELLALLPIFEERAIPVVSVTASPVSTLGRSSQVVVTMGRLHECGVQGLAPSTTTTAMLAIGDALAFVSCRRREFSARDFARLHPGGNLGKRLTLVKEVMRRARDVRIAPETSTVREVFIGQSRPGRRTGAVMLVDEEGLLTGLFTDSDLARLLEQKRDHQLDGAIREVMTSRPTTIAPDMLLEEVLQLFAQRRLSELPVVDDTGRPVGLVDITDMIGLAPHDPSGHDPLEHDQTALDSPAHHTPAHDTSAHVPPSQATGRHAATIAFPGSTAGPSPAVKPSA